MINATNICICDSKSIRSLDIYVESELFYMLYLYTFFAQSLVVQENSCAKLLCCSEINAA